MKKLDRFILNSFIGPFVAILALVVFILVMQFLWVYIDELVGKGLSFSVILEFLMWGGCTILPMALPLATLLATMWTIGQMSENFELIAVKSAGISLMRIIRPLMIASVLVTGLAFYCSDRVVPLAYDKIYTLRDDISKTNDEIKIPAGIFYNGIEGYVLRVEDRNDGTGMMYGVMVYDHTGNKGNTNVTIADSALIKMSSAKDYLTFTLYNGTNYQETNDVTYSDTTLQLQKIKFLKQNLIIPLENYSFEKSDSTRFSSQVKSLSMNDLGNYRDTLKVQFDKTHRSQVETFVANGGFNKPKQLDTSFLRKELPDFDLSRIRWNSTDDKINIYTQAQEQADHLEMTLDGFNRDIYESQYYLRRADLEFNRRYAGAIACLILFFIGAPLGAFVRKGGLGIAAITSVLFFVLYWVIDTICSKLAKDGAIDASSGAFLYAYIFIPIAIFLLWKAVRDSAFSTDQIKTAWRIIKRKIMSVFKKTRIVYMGTPEFAVAPLEALIAKGYEIAGVVTVADKPSGRGLKMNESAVKKYAVEHGIPVLQPVKLKDPEFLGALKELKADLFVVVAFRMLPEEVWSMPKLGTFNLHAALLPQYRGAAPINWAVINGEQLTGVTTFMIDKEIDTGGIILREDCRIKETDTAGDIHDKLMSMGADLVVETVEGILQGNTEIRVQRSFIQGAEVLKPAPKLTKELCHIDWNDSTKNVYNLIRGLSPYPTAYTELIPEEGGLPVQLKIFNASKMQLDSPAAPGTVLSDGKSYLAIATSDGAISINDLQLAGKKRMDVKAFLLGFRNPSSYTCTQGTSKAVIEKTLSR